MQYIPLYKIFYLTPTIHQRIYEERFNSVSCRLLPFSIKQFNRNKEFPAFFCYTEDLTVLIDSILRKHEVLQDIIRITPPIVLQQFFRFCLIEEIQSTNEIEGVRSTKQELRTAFESLANAPRFASIIKSYEHLISCTFIPFYSCADIRSFYESFTYDEVLRSDPSNRLDGNIFRANSVDVTSKSGKTIHRGLNPEDRIISAMHSALDLLHNDDIPLLIRLPVFHYFFSYIHPFYDGNGRTGRFIVSHFLAQRFHPLVGLRLSFIIRKNLSKYYKAFSTTDSAINCGDLTPFIISFLYFISDAFDDVSSILSRKLDQLNSLQQRLFENVPSDELSRLIYSILLQTSSFYGYGLSMLELMELTGKSRNTIQARLNSMPSDHLFIIKSKPFRYKINSIIFKRL